MGPTPQAVFGLDGVGRVHGLSASVLNVRQARRYWIGVIAAAGLCLAVAPAWPSSVAAAEVAQDVTYDIPAQPLTKAIEAFALATGIQVLYDRPMGVEPQSPGVRGRMSTRQALDRLLVGTQWTARFTDARSVVLKQAVEAPSVDGASAGSPPDLPSLALGTLHVVGPPVLEAPARRGGYTTPYGEVIRGDVVEALGKNPRTARAHYRVGLSIWISPSGAIRTAKISQSSGDKNLDAAICSVLEQLVVEQTPPSDLPLPVKLLISSREPR